MSAGAEQAALEASSRARAVQGSSGVVVPMQERREVGDVGESASVLRALANDVETALNAVGRSLTEPESAEVYVQTLAVVQHVLRGAVAQGMISGDQQEELAVLLEGLMESPRYV